MGENEVQRGAWSKSFLVFITVAAVFVWVSSQSLPAVVASHFGLSGQANGFMPREAYVWFMVALIAALPVLIVYLPNRLIMGASDKINLPNRDYWLAPERRQETIEYMCRVSFRFGYLLVGFLAYVHWLVVRANSVVPPDLSSGWLVGGLVMFVAATCATVLAIFRRFGRVPS
jgi:uncharacterized membrane protein